MIRQIQEILNTPEDSEHRGYFIINDIAYRKTRQGHDYATMLLKDASGTIPAKLWREKLPLLDRYNIKDGSRVMVKLKVNRYRGRVDAEIRDLRPIESADREDGFEEHMLEQWAARDVDEMYAELSTLVNTIEREPVRALVHRIMEKYGKTLKVMPGARSIHHAYRGGLLEHILAVARISLFLGGVYHNAYPQGIDRDILLAGAILHDVGKIEEIDPEKLNVHTAYGSLIGHILISRDIVRDMAVDVQDLDPRDLLLLEHLIVSHQGRKEWGAPQEPKTAEAIILHYADDCDAKVNIFFSALQRDKSDGELTDYHKILGRQLWKKGGTPAPIRPEEGQQRELDLKPPEKEMEE
jgi:3'-5' exoribonuclease